MSEGSLHIPTEWREAAEEVAVQGGPVMIVGAPGSGKTTFCLYLTGYFCRHGKQVAWIDADPGQPFIGPPAALSLALFSDAAELRKEKTPLAMAFIGNTTPVGHLLESVTGIQKLFNRGRSFNPDLILANTSGLVNGGAARELRFHEIDMLAPRYVVALQRKGEVEHLLSPHSHRAGLLILRVPVSPDAHDPSREARLAARESKFKDYFRGAGFHDIALGDVGVHGPGLGTGERLGFRDVNRLSKILQAIVIHAELSADRLFILVEGEYAEGELFTAKELFGVREIAVHKLSELEHLLVGLNDDQNFCLALGVLRGLDVRELTLRVITPLRDVSLVRHVSLGSLKVSPAGGELGRW